MDYEKARERMVLEQIQGRGISSPTVLAALREIPRHKFVDQALEASAYSDHALPIGQSQTISQPYMVALMSELLALRPHDRVLEIGTGSGYQTAILSRLCRTVFTIERIPELGLRAQKILAELGLENVVLRIGDGTIGWSRFAPFQGIIVTAGAPEVPPTLVEQLAEGGRLVVPTGPRGQQRLLVLQKEGPGRLSNQWSVPCTFVPLIGREGWGPGEGAP
jgi:protein-L-isoaspartate(D-aspartate) O-methyltransferase